MGYDIDCKILCASDYGVPQSRRRVVFVGTKQGEKAFAYPNALDAVVTCEMALSDLPPLVDELGNEIQEYPCPPQNEYQQLMRQGSTKIAFTKSGTGRVQN